MRSLPTPAYTLSSPSPGEILSLPRLPQRRSLPRLPQRWSALRLPLRRSLPRLPLRRSSPSRPVRWSGPRRPVKRSSLSVPTSVSSPPVPVRTFAMAWCPAKSAPTITTITVIKMCSLFIRPPPLVYVELILPPLRPVRASTAGEETPLARYYAPEQRVKPERSLGHRGGAQHLVVVVATHTNGQEVSEDEAFKGCPHDPRESVGHHEDGDQRMPGKQSLEALWGADGC